MADLTIGNTNVTSLLKEKYKKLGNGWLTMIEVPAEKHMHVNSESIRILTTELDYTCVYVTLGKSYSELDTAFKARGVKTDNMYYIDAVSKMYGTAGKDTKRVIYTAGPLDIDALTVSIRELIRTIPAKKKCVFLDSVTTVMLYNSLSRTIRFSKFLTSTLKSIGIDGVMVSIAKGVATKKLTSELQKLTDEYIVIKDGGGR